MEGRAVSASNPGASAMNAVAPERGQSATVEPQEVIATSGRQQQEVWMLGPVPPPVTGMTLLTKAVVRAMQQAGPARFLSWSPGMPRRTLRMRLIRNLRIVGSMIRLLTRGPVKQGRLYLVANAQSGLYLTAPLVLLGRWLGYTVYLHHHVYSYIDRYDWRMAWIDRRLGGQGVHIVHTEKMADDFRSRYASQNKFLIVHPSIVEIPIDRPRGSFHRPFRLGLLSSLSLAKGLVLAIETFEEIRAAGRDATLTLAGPIPSTKEKRILAQAVARYPGLVRYVGAVYGEEKSRFFAEIDAFVFPTLSESWGLVLNEALGAGLPVITFDRGCTATVVGTEAGRVIAPHEPFAAQAAQQIIQWMDDEEAYRRASQAAIAQAQRLQHDAQRTLAQFVEHMFSDLPPKVC